LKSKPTSISHAEGDKLPDVALDNSIFEAINQAVKERLASKSLNSEGEEEKTTQILA